MKRSAHARRLFAPAAISIFLTTVGVSDLAAQGSSVGGHIGLALPIVSRSQGDTSTMTEDFAVSIPAGIIFLKNGPVPIDLAVFPTFVDGGLDFGLGIATARGIGSGYAVAMGVYVDFSNSAWGIAPALDKVLVDLGSGKALIADLMVPIQFNKDDDIDRTPYTSVGLGVHVGFAF